MRMIESRKTIKQLKVTAYYTGKEGTYSSVMPTSQSAVYLKACCDIARDMGFEGATSPFDMHVTVIHSKKGLTLAEQHAAWNSGIFGVNQQYDATPKHFTHWAGHDETGYLVLELDSPELSKVNKWLRDTFDMPVSFDEYKAHLTIVTDAYAKGGTDAVEKLIAELNKIPMPDTLTFQGLRIEDLK